MPTNPRAENMINLDPIKVISTIAKYAASPIITQVKRNETIIKIFKELSLDPLQPPKDVDGVYAYTLVEYGVSKTESLLKLFREKEIKTAFWEAYTSKSPVAFLKSVEKFLEGNKLGDELRAIKFNISKELEEFGQAFIQVAQRTQSQEYKPYPDWKYYNYPAEFESLIQEKTKNFQGRNFVFTAINDFITKHDRGYFVVLGDAGMGKSSISAKYVSKHKNPCYFNIRSEGRNRPELFLESIRQQLIYHYLLQNAEKDDLATLLEKVSQKMTTGKSLIIVVDALDEVEQEPGDNLLYLPTTLPDGVYFVLTRRPYILKNKRLLVSPGVPYQELDLRDEKYMQLSEIDIKDYIRLFLQDPEHQGNLQKWIQDRNTTADAFVEQVAVKSQNNFMYLRHLLPAIAKGKYDKDFLELRQLPDGLEEYYENHWVRMKMDQDPQNMMVILLFILVVIGTPIPCEMIAKIADQDEAEVGQVLDELWYEYLTVQEIQGESCYSIYHASFLEFLQKKRELKGTRKLFDEVNRRIADYLEGEMAEEDEEGEDEEEENS
jgi:hypothetical protein